MGYLQLAPPHLGVRDPRDLELARSIRVAPSPQREAQEIAVERERAVEIPAGDRDVIDSGGLPAVAGGRRIWLASEALGDQVPSEDVLQRLVAADQLG